ncbi:hypothetical protein J8L70_01645 [Pseudoalteromonas sp. MMG010]|uniref:protein YgfX n=1 Tax=Pseudoalteromonas sp. MMG010 TaxID=2822685 RepID=UPI001B39F96A|nr:protein YgfX [Pseudoalteromonas sp. MMG010]MBQ4831934.1 hypothetical protein [Pseudoalteromonas sp. MMG010]
MYRFSVLNNKVDHQPVVVFFLLICLLTGILAPSWKTLFVIFIINGFAAWWVWQKIHTITPRNGIIVLDANLLRFSNQQSNLQGEITKKSWVFNAYVLLNLQGFSHTHWLIISANGIDSQSFVRLKRTIVTIKQALK